jgi:hypothetical protein
VATLKDRIAACLAFEENVVRQGERLATAQMTAPLKRGLLATGSPHDRHCVLPDFVEVAFNHHAFGVMVIRTAAPLSRNRFPRVDDFQPRVHKVSGVVRVTSRKLWCNIMTTNSPPLWSTASRCAQVRRPREPSARI